jgi:hypothetical protein
VYCFVLNSLFIVRLHTAAAGTGRRCGVHGPVGVTTGTAEDTIGTDTVSRPGQTGRGRAREGNGAWQQRMATTRDSAVPGVAADAWGRGRIVQNPRGGLGSRGEAGAASRGRGAGRVAVAGWGGLQRRRPREAPTAAQGDERGHQLQERASQASLERVLVYTSSAWLAMR